MESTATREEDGSTIYDVTLRASNDATMRGMRYLLESKEVRNVNCLPPS